MEFRGSSWLTSCKMRSNGILERHFFAPVPRRLLSRWGHPLLDAPRTDPGGRNSRTGLPPRVVNDESHEQLRVHSRASGTRLIRHSVRYVCCSPMFPSVLSLGSTNSAPSRPGLFIGFNAIMKRSDFSCPCFIGFDSSPSRCGPLHDF